MHLKANINYLEIRTALLGAGYSIRSWAIKHQLPVTTVYGAARGERNGIQAHRIRRQLETLVRKQTVPTSAK